MTILLWREALREQRHQSFLVSLTIRTWTGRDSARSPETFREPRSRDTSRARCGRPCPSAPLVSRLPLGIVGGAAATAWLPVLSRRLAASDEGGAAETWTARSKASCCWPCQCVGADDGGQAVVSTLFERGAFTAGDSAATAAAITGAARRRDFRDITQHGRGVAVAGSSRARGGNGIDADARAGGGALRGGVQPAPRARDGDPAPVPCSDAAGAALQVLGRRLALHAGVAGRPGGHDPRLSPPVHQIMLVVNGIHLRAVTGDVRRRASVRTGEPSPKRYVQ